MTALANTQGAINLAQGFPDFATSHPLQDLVHAYMRKGFNQYAPMPGIMPLRERIAEKYVSIYDAVYDPEKEITITAGATQAIYTCIAATIHEGDEVILFEPAYDCYAPAIRLHGGVPVHVELTAPDYNIPWDMVKKKISGRTRMIMINTPHNPTGSIWNASDMEQLEKIVHTRDIIVLSDEVYEHVLFDEARHESVLRYPNLKERSFVIFSFGKTYHNTGWKIGYVLAPEALTKEFRNVHQFLVFSVNTPIQYALADHMMDISGYHQVHTFYQEKRDAFLHYLKGSRFTFTPAKGTYFQLLDYSAISSESDVAFADRITIEHKVASIPLSPFYTNAPEQHVLRFCFAKEDSTLQKAADILCKI
ncbi:MAG: methionine aminotransferase [Chitinophagales bacterium]